MKIELTGVFVDDQARALKFYTEVLGFIKKTEIPAILWVTIVSPEEPGGAELLLEPNSNPAASTYQEAIYRKGIAATAFAVEDIQAEYERLKNLGVAFTMPPTDFGGVIQAVLDDTCRNLLQIYQA